MADVDISSTASDIIKGGAIVVLGGAAFIVVVRVAEALLALV